MNLIGHDNNTVDREFLYEVASRLGVGAGFVSWMKLLLTDTFSCALVNGFKSALYKCEAGVRQGCPLAPFLYLFAGQALLCFMQQQGVGIDIAGRRVVATQYADDVEPCLPDTAAVPAFVADMAVFGQASGQHLQPPKCKLLPMGRVPSAVLASGPHAGLPVVPSATSLGVKFSSMGAPSMDWPHRVQRVKERMQRISTIPGLSAFGRAFAVNGYALSTLLYGAQFACAIPAAHAVVLQQWSAALVDAGKGPEDDLRRPPGIPWACMAAHPRVGGFGLLPLRAHMFSRWACEGASLLHSRHPVKPWQAVATALLQQLLAAPAYSGAWSLTLCARHFLFEDHSAYSPLPHPLRAFAIGMRALPPVAYVGEGLALPVGDWCYHAPLWSNPLLVRKQAWDWFGAQRQVVVGLEWVAPPGLLNLPRLQTVGQAVLLLAELERVCALPGGLAAQRTAYNRDVLGPWLLDRGPYADKQLALDHVRLLVSWLPAEWVARARLHTQAFPAPRWLTRPASQLLSHTSRLIWAGCMVLTK